MLTSAEHKLNTIMSTIREARAEVSLGVNVQLSGKYRAVVTRGGEIIQETEWFDNLILNQGLDQLGLAGLSPSTVTVNRYCHVGTGTSTATPTQTQLDAFLASVDYDTNVASDSVSSGAPNWIRTNTQKFIFAQGAVIGNISEVGVGWTPTNGNLFSRARIVDGSNNPTTIALTSIDQLTVFWALTLVPIITSTSGSVTLAGTAYPYTISMFKGTSFGIINTFGNIAINDSFPFLGFPRPSGSGIFAYLYGVGATMASPPINQSSDPTGSYPSAFLVTGSGATTSYSYTAGTYTANASLAVQPGYGNFAGGIKAMRIDFTFVRSNDGFSIYLEFGTPVPKLNTQRLTLSFSTTWSSP